MLLFKSFPEVEISNVETIFEFLTRFSKKLIKDLKKTFPIKRFSNYQNQKRFTEIEEKFPIKLLRFFFCVKLIKVSYKTSKTFSVGSFGADSDYI